MPTQRRVFVPPAIVAANPIEWRVRGDFVDWLAAAGGTLAVTTYNSGKLAFFWAASGRLAASFWSFPRPMGCAYALGQLAVASQRHIWIFSQTSAEDVSDGLPIDESLRDSQPVSEKLAYIKAIYSTGRLDVHDLAFDRRGLLFANTRFNCIARPSERANFTRTWRPPFIAHPMRKDCCHLNGVGVCDGRLAMATAFCERDAPAAWREVDRFQSGVLIDVRENRVAARGLCMPHSPRWHAGRWWLCNSGEGALCVFHPTRSACEPVTVLPGFTRGLCFAGGRAIVGLSRIRKRHILDAPPVRTRFPRMRSGLWLVDPTTGVTTGALEFTRGGREVYDLAYLPRFPGEPLARG
jgi:uncharacterized protein (TIGR03032 family)